MAKGHLLCTETVSHVDSIEKLMITGLLILSIIITVSETLQYNLLYRTIPLHTLSKALKGVQPMSCEPHVVQGGYECSPTQNHKFT